MSNDESAMVLLLRRGPGAVRIRGTSPVILAPAVHGRLSERPMEADCKSVAVCLRRFESCPCHHGTKAPDHQVRALVMLLGGPRTPAGPIGPEVPDAHVDRL